MMLRSFLILISFLFIQSLIAQKKPLDHSVYDSWQSIGQKLISNDGKWVIYTIDPQEGDNELVIQSTQAEAAYKKTIARGYNALITEDSRFVIFSIKPFFKETREAGIKKKKTDEMPKDSLAIVELGKDSVWKKANIQGYKTPAKSFGWLAYHVGKTTAQQVKANDSKKLTDSLNKVIDSLKAIIESASKKKMKSNDDFAEDYDATRFIDADGDDNIATTAEAGTELWLRNLQTGEEKLFRNVVEYYFSKNGRKLLLEQSGDPKDSLSKITILLHDLAKGFADTLSIGGNEFKNFAITDDGAKVAYVAERDAKPKDLEKFYKLWYYREGMDSATILAAKTSIGMQVGMTISEFGSLEFSKSGRRLFFGTAPIQATKDTSLVEIDLVKLDVWHYNDDYLQTVQLNRLQQNLQQSFLAVYDFEENKIEQLATPEIPIVYQTSEGDGDTFVGVTDVGKRIESQWTNITIKDIYAINVKDGSTKLVKKDLSGVIAPSYISPTGKYIMWYDYKAKNYFAYDGDSARNISSKIKVPLYNEENDSPSDPAPYGVMGWHEGDSAVYVYDRFDVWRIDADQKIAPKSITIGRTQKNVYRYVRVDNEERFFKSNQGLIFRFQDREDKSSGIGIVRLGSDKTLPVVLTKGSYVFGALTRAKDIGTLIYTRESYREAPDLYMNKDVLEIKGSDSKMQTVDHEAKLSSINLQQKDYNWGTAELYKWKTFKGKPSLGILYRPENFDPAKKYPLILYFYEKLSDGLNNYHPPAPTPSRLNISFFVSRGYLVFAPDISYTIGHPAQSAYDCIVSAAKDLAKHKWVDAENIGIQGQSWGGIQVAQLITMTDMFKAAWAGAPVANMTSGYGGIRWETGLNRQFQYEKTQSRIGATLWEKPQLYIENSPLFHLPKVKTPLVLMSNDADGAVPWYQGIEMFTAMRRLGKKVWMLNYNGEAHNLVQRKNRKDIQIREQQYFDWLLKGEKPTKWIIEGIPAVKKGKDWGFEID